MKIEKKKHGAVRVTKGPGALSFPVPPFQGSAWISSCGSGGRLGLFALSWSFYICINVTLVMMH